ncbi:hypothetical protein HanPI659440_Chr08g0298591 [Helianthus annuus]|nr:hypothetical protein HanPI659440_Chr08g0298591 [Helianthus annuus]
MMPCQDLRHENGVAHPECVTVQRPQTRKSPGRVSEQVTPQLEHLRATKDHRQLEGPRPQYHPPGARHQTNRRLHQRRRREVYQEQDKRPKVWGQGSPRAVSPQQKGHQRARQQPRVARRAGNHPHPC